MSESPVSAPERPGSGGPVPSRRVAGTLDRTLVAALCAAALVAWIRLPAALSVLVDQLPPGLPMALRRLPEALLSTATVPWQVEWAVSAAGLFVLSSGLHRMEIGRFRLTRPLLGLSVAIIATIGLSHLLTWFSVQPAFLPVGLAGLWVAASFGPGAGLLTSLCVVGSLALGGVGTEVLPLLLLRAVLPVLFFRDRRRASAGFWAAVGAGVAVTAVEIARTGILGPWAAPGLMLPLLLLLGGLVEGSLFVLTRGMGERLLGHVSRERLHGLLDLEQPLLQRMLQRAPGSFEHSRAMANLAEQAASAIGADALLTRVGAYYHDLGKSYGANYFIENLEPAQRSPHDELSPLESARRIHRHVIEGVEVLRSEGIPEAVVEFAYTHHGTQRVEYFLGRQRHLCEVSGEQVDEEAFRYPGMKPCSRETAILMLVDSIEAASRTLDECDVARFEEMARRIVFAKLAAGQLDHSGLTMEDLRVLCDRVVVTLVHMNHHRIKYPWQEERTPKSPDARGQDSRPVSAVGETDRRGVVADAG